MDSRDAAGEGVLVKLIISLPLCRKLDVLDLQKSSQDSSFIMNCSKIAGYQPNYADPTLVDTRRLTWWGGRE